MSKDKLDMSLEDIISMNKGGSGGRGSGRRNPNYPRRGGGDFFRTRDRGDRSRGVPGVSRGGIQKRDNRSTFTKEIPDQWQHDLFEDAAPRRSFDDRRQSDDRNSGALHISNLHYGVNDSDMKELFMEFGPLVKAAVHYDRSGRSLGTAEIVFKSPADAARAMKQYNNVSLDGQPMKISLMNDNASQGRGSLASRIGPSRSNDDYRPPRRQGGDRGRGRGGFGNRQRRGGGGSGGGGGRGGRRERDVPTKEQLDAELDAYNAKMETD